MAAERPCRVSYDLFTVIRLAVAGAESLPALAGIKKYRALARFLIDKHEGQC